MPESLKRPRLSFANGSMVADGDCRDSSFDAKQNAHYYRAPLTTLNLHSVLVIYKTRRKMSGFVYEWLRGWESDPRPSRYERDELPLFYPALIWCPWHGLEPATSLLQKARSTFGATRALLVPCCSVVRAVRLEPTTSCFQGRHSTN